MLPSLDALRSIDFSAQRLSPTILSVIGQLPSLEILGLWIQYPAYLRLARNFTLSNVTGVFPKLIELDIRSSFNETFASLLTNIITNCTHTLTNLSLHHRMDTEHKANIRAVVKAVAIQKRLTYLILADVLVDVLEVDILEPLGLCTELEWLRIEISAFTLAVAEERVSKLIRRLPYLKDLYVRLGERPGRWADGWTPLRTIVLDNKRLSIPNRDLRE
ncbi:hypothetical protein FRB97_005620 [Tulasnella sp. 331]|nr:hypothetical protein FRB97_005620 [Tulasnella sp. 331]